MANHSVWLYSTKFSHDHLCASGTPSVDSRTCLHDPRLSWRGGGLARSCEYKSGSGQFTLISGPLSLPEFLPPIGQLTGDSTSAGPIRCRFPVFGTSLWRRSTGCSRYTQIADFQQLISGGAIIS